MSHEVETMAYANEVPWHGLGARVDQGASVPEMLKAAGLDWTVQLCPMTAQTPWGDSVAVKDRFALVRDSDNRVLTVTGKSWKPLQNAETLGFMQEYVEAGGATLETAGSLRGGKVVWGLARLNHTFEVSKGDKVNGYLLITSPHEVGRAITVRTTTVRVVCANTMAMANRESTVNYKQNHLSDFDVVAAKQAVASAHEDMVAACSRAQTLHKLKLSMEDAVKKVIAPVLMPDLLRPAQQEDVLGAILEERTLLDQILDQDKQPKLLQQILDSYHNAPGAEPGTGWGALNAVTHWADHVAGRDAGSRMYRSWVGDTAREKLAVEERLLELAA